MFKVMAKENVPLCSAEGIIKLNFTFGIVSVVLLVSSAASKMLP